MDVTTQQRTYRYLRLSIVGAVLFLGAGLAWQLAAHGPLESISAAYYTAVRGVFVGTLIAVSVALISLGGRTRRRFLLLVAALLAPIIALVPTPISNNALTRLAGRGCPGNASECIGVPTEQISGPLTALLVVELVGAVVGLLVVCEPWNRKRRNAWRSPAARGALGVLIGLVGVTLWTTIAPGAFRSVAHYGSAAIFFALIGTVVVMRSREVNNTDWEDKRLSKRFFVRCYRILAALMIADVLIMIALVPVNALAVDVATLLGSMWVFGFEGVALLCFTAYWLVQTLETWSSTNPSLAEPNYDFDPEDA